MLIVYIIAVDCWYYVTVYMTIRVGSLYMLTAELEWNSDGITIQCVILCYSEHRGDADILFYGNVSYVVIQTFLEHSGSKS